MLLLLIKLNLLLVTLPAPEQHQFRLQALWTLPASGPESQLLSQPGPGGVPSGGP